MQSTKLLWEDLLSGFLISTRPVTDQRRHYCNGHCTFTVLPLCYKHSILCLHIHITPKFITTHAVFFQYLHEVVSVSTQRLLHLMNSLQLGPST